MESRGAGKQRFKIPNTARILALACGMLTACGEVTGGADGRFVALDSVFDGQVKRLETLNPQVKKSVLSEAGEETKVFQDIDWQKELSAFRQADLSKTGLRGAYSVNDVAPNVRLFQVKPGEKAEVQELRVEFTADHQIKSVQSLVNDQNYLYHTRRTFRVEFGPKDDQWLVRSYQVEGFQKLLWSKAKPFAVRAEVL